MGNEDDFPVRLFYAMVPDTTTRRHTASVAGALPVEHEARQVPHLNHHMTLAFVGELPAACIHVLREIGRAQRATAFALRFDAYEYWPKPEVIVAAARTIPVALQRLWQHLHHDLSAHRWALDAKRLRPHVTLARKVSQAPVLQAMSSFDWRVCEFSLMRSDRRGPHSAYTVLDTWPLLDESEKA